MKKRSKKIILIITGILLAVIGITTVFFTIPYSKTKTEFMVMAGELISKTGHASGVFTEEDIADLPLPVQKYFRACGYLGAPKMSYMRAIFQDVDFILDKDKPAIKIDYTQYDFVPEPNRIAYIDSSMYGIPFEGLDAYVAGAGSMKGVLAKLFTLFDQTGEAMDKASLVTCLSECLIIPNMALQDYIVWEEIDALHAKATISYYGITAEGIFTFNENGEMLSFTTDDREAVAADGTSEKVKWTAVCSEYVETNGIKKPTVLKAIWHYDDGDLVYFDGKDVVIEFDTRE
jgi:L-rhamnose mutarotase